MPCAIFPRVAIGCRLSLKIDRNLEGSLSVATWDETAWIGGTASGTSYISVVCSIRHVVNTRMLLQRCSELFKCFICFIKRFTQEGVTWHFAAANSWVLPSCRHLCCHWKLTSKLAASDLYMHIWCTNLSIIIFIYSCTNSKFVCTCYYLKNVQNVDK